MSYTCYVEGYGASDFEAAVVRGLPVYREAIECALEAHKAAVVQIRQGRADKARQTYRSAAAHCRVLGVIPWAINPIAIEGALMPPQDTAENWAEYWIELLSRQLAGDLMPEYLRDPGRWDAWPSRAAAEMADRAGVRDRTLWTWGGRA